MRRRLIVTVVDGPVSSLGSVDVARPVTPVVSHSPDRMLAGENISRLSGFRLVWWGRYAGVRACAGNAGIHAAAGLW